RPLRPAGDHAQPGLAAERHEYAHSGADPVAQRLGYAVGEQIERWNGGQRRDLNQLLHEGSLLRRGPLGCQRVSGRVAERGGETTPFFVDPYQGVAPVFHRTSPWPARACRWRTVRSLLEM